MDDGSVSDPTATAAATAGTAADTSTATESNGVDGSNRGRWEAAFGRSRLRDADFTTMSGIPLEPVYGPDGAELPGEYPYTRGPYASMYRSKLWTMRMFAGFGTADDTNWRFKEIIRAGGDGLSTAFDMPTLLGLDSDAPMAEGEVGRCGVAIDSLRDMEDLYAGIALERHHDVDDHQLAGRGHPRHVHRAGREGRASTGHVSAARCRTTS